MKHETEKYDALSCAGEVLNMKEDELRSLSGMMVYFLPRLISLHMN